MGLQVGKLGAICAGWVTAIRDLPYNPLPHRLATADQRRFVGKPWFKANPGLFIIGSIIALVVTAYLIALLLRMADIGPAYTAQTQARALFSMGTSAVLIGGLVFTLCWVLSAIYRLSEFCLGFLSLHNGRSRHPGLDDETILTGVSPQEILAAAGLQMLRIMLIPLIVFSALAATTLAFLLWQSSYGLLTSIGNWTGIEDSTPYAVWWVASFFLRLLLHGLAATLIGGYFLVSLGRVKHPLWPVIGAVIHVVLQCVMFLRGATMGYSFSIYRQVESNGPVIGLCAGLLIIATLVLVLYIVLTVPLLRRVPILAAVIFCIISILAIASMIGLEQSALQFSFHRIITVFNWAGQSIAIINPAVGIPDQLAVGLGRVLDDSGKPFLFFEWWRPLLGALFQLLLLAVTGEFARQVVIHRLRGDGA